MLIVAVNFLPAQLVKDTLNTVYFTDSVSSTASTCCDLKFIYLDKTITTTTLAPTTTTTTASPTDTAEKSDDGFPGWAIAVIVICIVLVIVVVVLVVHVFIMK